MSQIIIDEQINLKRCFESIRSWITVRHIVELRRGSIIKDDVIPSLLCHQKYPTFVTINVGDFWTPKLCDRRYCILCFAVPDPKQPEIPHRLRRLFRMPEFKTRAVRMGKIVHVTFDHIRYYQFGDEKMHVLAWPKK